MQSSIRHALPVFGGVTAAEDGHLRQAIATEHPPRPGQAAASPPPKTGICGKPSRPSGSSGRTLFQRPSSQSGETADTEDARQREAYQLADNQPGTARRDTERPSCCRQHSVNRG